MRKFVSGAMGAVIGVTATLTAVNSSTAGVFPVDTATTKAAAPQDIVNVYYRGGGALFAGLALGLVGAAIAGSYYYAPPYYYPGYYPGYVYAPSPYPYYGSYYGRYPGYASYYPRYRYYGFRRHWW
jgi:hypothetical protein